RRLRHLSCSDRQGRGRKVRGRKWNRGRAKLDAASRFEQAQGFIVFLYASEEAWCLPRLNSMKDLLKRMKYSSGRPFIEATWRSTSAVSPLMKLCRGIWIFLELAGHDAVAVSRDAARGVAGVHDDFGSVDDGVVIVAGVVGGDDGRVVLAEALRGQRHRLHVLKIVVAHLVQLREVRIVVVELSAALL